MACDISWRFIFFKKIVRAAMVKNINKKSNYFPLQATEHKTKMKYSDGKPGFGLGDIHQYGGFKRLMGSRTIRY